MRPATPIALAIAAWLALCAALSSAQPRPDGSASTPGARAFAGTPILEPGGPGETRVAVPIDRRVEVTSRIELGRVIYRLAESRAAGSRSPVIAPRQDGALARVELVVAGGDLDLVIEVRRPVDARQRLVKTAEGFELTVTLVESPSGRIVPDPAAKSAAPDPAAKSVPEPSRPAPDSKEPAPSEAAPPAPPARDAAYRRSLSGHTFLQPVRFASAFIDTQLGLSIGFANTTFDSVDERDGTPYRAELVGLSQRIDLGVRILPRLALIAAAGGRLALGVDGQSVLNLGGQGGFTWMFGVAGIVARFERTGTQVGARLSVEGESGGRFVSLGRLIDDAIESQTVPSANDLFGSQSIIAGRFAWSAAQAIGRHLSVQASIGLRRTFTSIGERAPDHAFHLTGGLAIGIDAAPFVPLAAFFEYDGDALFAFSGVPRVGPLDMLSEEGGNTLLGGLYYSGRADLLLGVLGGAAFPADAPERTTKQARFELRYFF